MRKDCLENLTLTGYIEGQRKIANTLPNMVGRTGIRRDSKKTSLTKIFKRQEVVESHGCLRPEGTQHIKKVYIDPQYRSLNIEAYGHIVLK